MEPHLALNYLDFVNRRTRAYVFLMEHMRGMNIASNPGELGVLEATTLEHYERGLASFEKIDISESIFLSGSHHYSWSLWRRAPISPNPK